MEILVNQIGYETVGPKRGVIKAPKERRPKEFRIIESRTQRAIYSGKIREEGPVHRWKDWYFWSFDFSGMEQQGTFTVEVSLDGCPFRSSPFFIEDRIFKNRLISDILCYFKSQRCSGIYDKADHSRPFAGARTERVDVHGGWYDASGDFSKYFTHLSFSNFLNPQQTPIAAWNLLKTCDLLKTSHNRLWTHHIRRTAEEALHGADFLKRMQDPEGYFYERVSDQLSKDPETRMIHSWVFFKGAVTEEYKAGYRKGAGVAIAALGRISTLKCNGDYTSEEYLHAAIKGFHHLEEHNQEYLNDGKENIIDDYCALLGAVELYRATGKKEFHKAARRRARNLIERLSSNAGYNGWFRSDDTGKRPYFHPVEAGMPFVSLLEYYDVEQDRNLRSEVRKTVREALRFELSITNEVTNPFGLARQLVKEPDRPMHSSFFFPHNAETAPWWQGENARLASLAAAARLALPLFQKEKTFSQALQVYATDQLNWILGLNPYDTCMIQGAGRNNPIYRTDYPNSPGGICNGITAGVNDEEDIDFLPDWEEPGNDGRWRWSEQWIPHAAWFLLAISI